MKDNLLLSNVLHRPVRSLVSVIGIALGAMLIVATMGLANGTLRGNARREANVGAEILVRASGSFGLSGTETPHLPISQAASVARVEGVETVVPVIQILDAASDSETGSRLIDGVNFDEYARIAGLQIVDGVGLATEGDQAVVDSEWAIQKGLHIGSKLKIYDRDFEIVGIYSPPSGARIKIPLLTMQRQSGALDSCTTLLVKISKGFQEEEVEERIAEAFPDDMILLTKDFEELYLRAVPAIDVFLNVVIGIGAIIGSLVILLTMYTTVTERTRQIGILRSLGMSSFGIARLITMEALLISFLGIVLGILCTFPLSILLTHTSSSMQMSIEPSSVLITLFATSVGSLIGALFPAIRAARMDPVDALNFD
ncbi:MAG: ABC transporter permease [Acidobacteriota bacterium]